MRNNKTKEINEINRIVILDNNFFRSKNLTLSSAVVFSNIGEIHTLESSTNKLYLI
jgi:hypothetical protein